jgi:hypothetical protein
MLVPDLLLLATTLALAIWRQATADILAAFLAGPLTGTASSPSAAAARYPQIVGGAVNAKAPPPTGSH